MTKVPAKITIDRKQKKVFVDGVEFPWIITEAGPEVTSVAASDQIPVVTIPIFAADVEVIPAHD